MTNFQRGFLSALTILSLSTPHLSAQNASAAADEPIDSPNRQFALKAQLYLDSKGFGPGRIDARWGEFTSKASQRWNEANPDTPIPLIQNRAPDPTKLKEIPWSKPLITEYTITDADAKLVGSVPAEPEAKSKLDTLPYETLLEVVAEKFHAYPDFVVDLNPGMNPGTLKAGMTLKVPNVSEPFSVSAAKSASGATNPTGELFVNSQTKFVELRQNGKLMMAFPITPGAEGNQAPPGEWKIDVVAFMPTFRYDEKMLEEGERSEKAHTLPPGPNNPVGIVWMGINSDGIGLHGTSNPDDIGRNASHGCIRLANWDALKLGQQVGVGTKVTIQ